MSTTKTTNPRRRLAVVASLALASLAAAPNPRGPTTREAKHPPPLPLPFQRFVGTLGGEVVTPANQPNGNHVVLKVTGILAVDRNSRAADPNAVLLNELEIYAATRKNKFGLPESDPTQLGFVRSLEAGERLQIDVANPAGDWVIIYNLNNVQKDRGDAYNKKSRQPTSNPSR